MITNQAAQITAVPSRSEDAFSRPVCKPRTIPTTKTAKPAMLVEKTSDTRTAKPMMPIPITALYKEQKSTSSSTARSPDERFERKLFRYNAEDKRPSKAQTSLRASAKGKIYSLLRKE
ncbi:unnamed protein product [Cylicocyclus nassatus]|uniref:Uncharacterized protein n=1 Tax=Cylicocyclus nassatus TaxID=53992 RepID=A0AA36GUC4_CYLNA|nr:unnamed protein product [Cylicocyclus nassatus]